MTLDQISTNSERLLTVLCCQQPLVCLVGIKHNQEMSHMQKSSSEMAVVSCIFGP